jgi:FKBP-type peptidyl-prolyl cis-trans isomerase SlyD
MQVAHNKVVAFHYTLTSAQGEMIDTSADQAPLEYLHGHRNIIPGLEDALNDKSAGSKFSVTLESKDAYGAHNDELVKTLARADIEENRDLHVGVEFQMDLAGEPRMVTVREVEGDQVTVDGNHPLAGETLVFEIEITGIRDATGEELSHGHVHSHGGH